VRSLISIAFLCSSVLFACSGSSSSASAPFHTANLPVIPEVVSEHGVATLALRAALDRAGRPAFFWNGQEVAPTIRLRPGEQIRIHYENDLPEICGLGIVSDSNLHFHGLIVAPVVHSDDVILTTVSPGHSYDYVVSIDRTQPPGLYWYHPHPHGLSNWEIGNGMSGAIVVEGIADELPSLAGLREQVIVLRDIPVNSSVAAAELPEVHGPQPTGGPPAQDSDEWGPPCGVEMTATPTINGSPTATIGIRPGERQLWRILNASSHRHFDLALVSNALHIATTPMQLVARDGFPLGYYGRSPALEPVKDVLIPPAGRAEVVVTGPPQITYLDTLCYDAGPKGDINPFAILGELIDDRGTAKTAFVARPIGLAPPAAYRTAPSPAQRRTIRFGEDARGFYLNQTAYHPQAAPMVIARAGTTEEWTLENDTDEVHTFHIHQVHFIVERLNGSANRDVHWLDTVDVPPRRHTGRGRRAPSTITVLLDFRDPVVRGTFLFHCHILDHEDRGMMAKIRVI
jgi:FtsP/CotA-like multicopper oxidase with cupredoxin domain